MEDVKTHPSHISALMVIGGLIGLFIVLLGLFLINLVGSLIGIPTILSLPSFISGLKL